MPRADQVINVRPKLEKLFGFSQIVRSGSTIYIAGTLSADENGNLKGGLAMADQVKAIYEEIATLLAQLGVGPESIVKETIFTVDLDALMAAAGERSAFYANCSPPASTWVEVRRLFRPEFLLEVELTVEAPG